MIDHNLKLAHPLLMEGAKEDRNLSLAITEKEQHDFRQYMERQGIDFSRPVMLVGVTAKLAHKTWAEDRMTEVLCRFIAACPHWQLIFNYAPGQEAENAHRIFSNMADKASVSSVFLNIEAKSPRQLAAMAANCTAYFGNEGGARHIVHAMGRPSLVVCSPSASKATWLPHDTDITAIGLSASDIRPDAATLTPREQYDLITVDRLWPLLRSFCEGLQETPKL